VRVQFVEEAVDIGNGDLAAARTSLFERQVNSLTRTLSKARTEKMAENNSSYLTEVTAFVFAISMTLGLAPV